jgi:hypothetical protein
MSASQARRAPRVVRLAKEEARARFGCGYALESPSKSLNLRGFATLRETFFAVRRVRGGAERWAQLNPFEDEDDDENEDD